VGKVLSWGYQLVNRALHPLGLRLQKSSSPTRTFGDFFDHLRALDVEFKTVVDVGVARGTPAIYEAFPRARYFLVEPVAEFREGIERLKKTLDAEYIAAAAGARDGEIEFNVHNDLSGSSAFAQAEGQAADGIKRRVRAVRLDSVLPKNLPRPCLLKIDTQGAELDVMEGLGDRVLEMDVVIVETSLMRFRKEAPELAEVVQRFDQLGFVAYDLLEGHVRFLDNALAQVDFAFVPKTSSLRRDTRFFTEEQLTRYEARYRGYRPT
jgi:FkbM family methyltransferase